MASPCTGVCRVEAGLCIGCGRTLDEIAAWGSAGNEERRRVLERVAGRRRRGSPDDQHLLDMSDAAVKRNTSET